jgi:DNA repair exonuclease SbcCD ATPase subunit
MVDILSLRKKHNEAVGERNLLQKQLDSITEQLSSNENQSDMILKARIIVQTVAEQTQKKIEYHISNLVSLALAAVFPDPYTFLLRYVQRRGRTEADLIFVKDGNEGRPIDVSGGGPIDVAAYALRPATYSLKPTRGVFLLDEPFKFVSRDLQHKCSEMLKMIGEKLGVQHIIVSHIPELIDKADTVFEVVVEKGISKVKKG